MASMTHDTYQRPLFGAMDELYRKCLVGSSIAGAVFLLVVLLTPIRQQAITRVDELEQRFARLIVEKPKPAAPRVTEAATKTTVEQPPVPEVIPVVPKAPEPVAQPRIRKPEAIRTLPPDAGKAGRERAKEVVTSKLASTTASIDKTLEGLSSSLSATDTDSRRPSRRRRARSVRSGRSAGDVAIVETGVARSGAAANLGSSSVEGSLVAIGDLSSAPPAAGGSSPDALDDAGAAPGVYRSNASLLAVVQKYAAGIQYCYDNELKRNASLSGKLVASLTVAASGEVVNAAIVQNSVGSQSLAACALAQIREWKFPPIQKGLTTFQAPFVFTPPR